ncbi:MAG: Uma2 family endonuclease [Chloroflexi bacterium]|nr:Uma2 family endonuclease [Chloroflexota bacterium]
MVAEYLEFDRRSDYKNEYFDGQIFMMAGASPDHNLIQTSLVSALYARIRGKGCTVYGSDMRVKVRATESYAYPDLSLVCGRAVYEFSQPATLLNLKIIFEILSPSSERKDRVTKLRHYREIESLTDYVVISQSGYHIQHYSKDADADWLGMELVGPGASLTIRDLDCRIGLVEIYEQCEWSNET